LQAVQKGLAARHRKNRIARRIRNTLSDSVCSVTQQMSLL